MLGAGDGSPAAAPLAAQLGARTYRLVMDSTIPLEAYTERIEAYRAYGMRPQITVDGVGTVTRGSHPWQSTNYALRAFKRWPDTYSISVIGEPDSSLPAAKYASFFRRAYRVLKRAGVPRVLFGELTPFKPMEYTETASARNPIVADGWSWHCYDWKQKWQGVNRAASIHRMLKRLRVQIHTPRGLALSMYCTEYGHLTTERWGREHYNPLPPQRAAAYWRRAMRVSRSYLAQIVAWQIVPTGEDSAWDTSLVDRNGAPRPAFQAVMSGV